MLQNPKDVKNNLIKWIFEYFETNGKNRSAVIGISGGKDSSVVAALCKEALGKDRLIGVLMPNGVQNDIDDSLNIVKYLDIKHHVINISQTVISLKNTLSDSIELSEDTIINIPPRIRMSILYAIAQSLPNGGFVANTCNLSEDYVGYSTKFGDSAGDFSPLGNLTVGDVIQIGKELNLPEKIIMKTPSDGLCGLSDEEKLGFSYEKLDNYILTGMCENIDTKNKIDKLHLANLHKTQPMPMFSLR